MHFNIQISMTTHITVSNEIVRDVHLCIESVCDRNMDGYMFVIFVTQVLQVELLLALFSELNKVNITSQFTVAGICYAGNWCTLSPIEYILCFTFKLN